MDLEQAGTLCHQTGRRQRGREERASAPSSATLNIAEFGRNSSATGVLLSRAMYTVIPCVLGSPSPAVPKLLHVPSLYMDGDEPTSAGAVVLDWGLRPLCHGVNVLGCCSCTPKPTAVLSRAPLMDEVEQFPLHIAAFAVLLLDLLHLLGGCWTFSGLVGARCAAPNIAGRATASPGCWHQEGEERGRQPRLMLPAQEHREEGDSQGQRQHCQNAE